jgi:erythronate-4-phosphate dehydrogenase
MRIVADDKIPFLKGVLEPFADVEYLPGSKISRNDVKTADALIVRTRTLCNKSLLEGSKVKFIATATIGFDHIDARWCEQQGIKWISAAGCNSTSVMQWVASVLANMANTYKFNFADKTLGIIGFGNVGSKVARLGEALGMHVVLNDPPVARNISPCGLISLEGVIREADIISLHVPLKTKGDDKTWHLFNESNLKNLRPNTILINSSRGEVVDTVALYNALINNNIKAVALDVWENEPEIDANLLASSFIGTPHIAGYSADGKARGTELSVQAISKFFHLGIDDWKVTDIPGVVNSNMYIDASGQKEQDIISKAILFTYNVKDDDFRLRDNLTTFEALREKYPLRREFSSYTIYLKNGSESLISNLRSIGFIVIED